MKKIAILTGLILASIVSNMASAAEFPLSVLPLDAEKTYGNYFISGADERDYKMIAHDPTLGSSDSFDLVKTKSEKAGRFVIDVYRYENSGGMKALDVRLDDKRYVLYTGVNNYSISPDGAYLALESYRPYHQPGLLKLTTRIITLEGKKGYTVPAISCGVFFAGWSQGKLITHSILPSNDPKKGPRICIWSPTAKLLNIVLTERLSTLNDVGELGARIGFIPNEKNTLYVLQGDYKENVPYCTLMVLDLEDSSRQFLRNFNPGSVMRCDRYIIELDLAKFTFKNPVFRFRAWSGTIDKYRNITPETSTPWQSVN